ncbi:hypothetical protein Csa_006677 [Cucumis sativus]|uniref:Uncharacterized protein n=1 Tax=Cucumis sativus TaxID=3659 RepID=A0A0A0LNI1_CUCSA|nr:hypothetical protein Csa_006677 [Cucumis sativus]
MWCHKTGPKDYPLGGAARLEGKGLKRSAKNKRRAWSKPSILCIFLLRGRRVENHPFDLSQKLEAHLCPKPLKLFI